MLSGAGDGDMRCSNEPGAVLAARRRAMAPGRWRWLRQCHGAGVVVLGPEEVCEGRQADALVTQLPGAPLAVFSADCALMGLASPEGVAGVVHAGWRGLLAGVIERTVEAMREAGATRVKAVVGACIGPECYEFGAGDIGPIVDRYGPSVASRTSSGTPALDLRAGVHLALAGAEVEVAADHGLCTACGPDLFSWRARKDTGRQALVLTSSP